MEAQEAGGINMSGRQPRLLEKVEELTPLHIVSTGARSQKEHINELEEAHIYIEQLNRAAQCERCGLQDAT